jgi:transposase
LLGRKLRTLELKAGHKARRGQEGSAHAYNVKGCREQERQFVEQAEAAYAHFVVGWMSRGAKPMPKARTSAANE